MRLSSCPLITNTCESLEESRREANAEIRAYKLSRQRWSYNCCKLNLTSDCVGGLPIGVSKAIDGTANLLPKDLQESAIAFKVQLENGKFIALHVYLVYDSARELPSVPHGNQVQRRFEWFCVSRDACKRGCKGPLLHSVQRYGPAGGKRSSSKGSTQEIKSAEHLYISVDEAASHVGVQHFRLIFGAFSPDGARLLGTTCSMPVRVIANNDVPQGPSSFQVNLRLSAGSSTSHFLMAPHQPSHSCSESNFSSNLPTHELGHVLTAQQISDDHVLDMINSSEGQEFAMRHNATPVLLLLHACSSCQMNEDSMSEGSASHQVSDWGELERSYPEQIDTVKHWCQSRKRAKSARP